jgi:dTDP-4-amino-4,6-dideoxygalactose transaminase
MIKFNDVSSQWPFIASNATKRINKLHESGDYILGADVEIFENKFSEWNGNSYSMSVSNGLDGLYLAGAALNLTGTVRIYIPSNTFIATFFGLQRAYPNASFVSIDCTDSYLIDINLLKETINNDMSKFDNFIIVPVHLYGKACSTDEIRKIIPTNGYIIEDCSQSHGAKYDSSELKVGNLGDISVFSLYPGKNLGGIGDGGIIVTENIDYMKRVKFARNVGMTEKYKHDHHGGNYRMDSLNAIVLDEKLKHIDDWTIKRQQIALKYIKGIKNSNIILPNIQNIHKHAFHIFCLRTFEREAFIDFMKKNNIQVLIHYPSLWHNQKAINSSIEYISNNNAENYVDQIVSIPMHPFLTNNEIENIISIINKFYV